jgi:hypothetical protein
MIDQGAGLRCVSKIRLPVDGTEAFAQSGFCEHSLHADHGAAENGALEMIRLFRPLILSIAFSIIPLRLASAQEELKIGAVGSLSGGGAAWGLATQHDVQLVHRWPVRARYRMMA